MFNVRRLGPRLLRRGYLGVWDPTGGETREGSGLPVEAGSEEIRILARLDGREVREIPLEKLESPLEEAEAIWIDLLRPQERSNTLLEGVLYLNPLTVEDCLSPLRMPKVDVFSSGGAFVAAFAARAEREEWTQLRAVEVDLVVGENYLVTVRDCPVSEVQERLQKRLASPLSENSSGEELLYEALDALVDGHLPALVGVAEASEELEGALDPTNQRASIGALENLISLKRDLQAFRRLAVAQQEIIRRIGRASPLRDYLSDAADNQREAVDMADATRDYVDGAIEAYRMRRDERTEVGIRRLTVLAALFAPLSLLAGIYGVTFRHLPGASDPVGFWIFIGVQAVFVVVAAIFLHRRGLL